MATYITFQTVNEADIASNAKATQAGTISFTEKYIYLGLGNGKKKRYAGGGSSSSGSSSSTPINGCKYIGSFTSDALALADANAAEDALFLNSTQGTLKIIKSGAAESIISGGVSQTDLTSVQNTLESKINLKANIIDVYTKGEVYSKVESETNFAKKADVYTKTESDTTFATKADTYTKTEADSKIAAAVKVETDRATATETQLNQKIDLKTQAVTYGASIELKVNDFVIHANKIYLATKAFTTTGVFDTDKANLYDLASSMSSTLGVVEYSAGIEIKNGQQVIHENKLYVCKADITTTDWTTDETNMIAASADIDLSGYYKKSEVDAIAAAKEDKLTQGTGVVVSRVGSTITVGADMTITADGEKIVQRDADGKAYAKNGSTLTDDELVNYATFKTTTDAINTTVTNTKTNLEAKVATATNTVNSFSSRLTKVEDATGVSSGSYQVYTLMLDMTKAVTDPTSCITLLDDAKGKTRDQIVSFLGFYPVSLSNGSEYQKLNPNNYKQTTASAAATLAIGIDVMVCFPRRGVKRWKEGSRLYMSITNNPNASGYSYASFINGTKDNTEFYYGAYEGYVLNSKLYSVSGYTPAVNATLTNFRKYAQARGTGYQLIDVGMVDYVQCCYLMVYQSLNSQKTVGMGRCSGGSVINTGGSDTWGLHSQNATSTLLTATTNNVKCLGIEDLWGNAWDWVDGLFIDNVYNICKSSDPSLFNDSGKGYISKGKGINYGSGEVGHISEVCWDDERGFLPQSVQNGSDSTFFCDYFWQNVSRCAIFGCSYYHGSVAGVFCWHLHDTASDSGAVTSSRLAYRK